MAAPNLRRRWVPPHAVAAIGALRRAALEVARRRMCLQRLPIPAPPQVAVAAAALAAWKQVALEAARRHMRLPRVRTLEVLWLGRVSLHERRRRK